MKNYRRLSRTVAGLLGVCVLALAMSALPAGAKIEGLDRTTPPPWLGLFGVAIQPDGPIFAVGGKGLLLTSTDEGKTWSQIPLQMRPGGPLFQDWDLYSIRFSPSGKLGLIVGENGTIVRSDDKGATWKTVPSGTTKNLMKVFAVDDQNAVAVGADSTILRTTDGGETWQSEKSPVLITLFDVDFIDKNTGWIAGEFATVFGTTDGGQTWTLLTGGKTSDFTIGPYFTVNFSDAQHGVVAGLAGDVETTDDGGKTWKPAKLPEQSGTYAVAIDPATKKVWAVGLGGRTFELSTGGQWVAGPRPTFNDLTDIALAGQRGVIVGLNGTILLSDDAGEKWQVVQ